MKEILQVQIAMATKRIARRARATYAICFDLSSNYPLYAVVTNLHTYIHTNIHNAQALYIID